MKLFILENCPHCRNARRWIKELQDENPEYNQIEIELIDEQINSELADQYDYYQVPALFDGNTKLHEGVASKDGLKKIFDQYLGHQFVLFILNLIQCMSNQRILLLFDVLL